MKELIDMFNERETKFKDITIEIFLAIDLSIECVEAFLSNVEPMFKVGDFSWSDVYMEDDLVTILGLVSFEPGMNIETDDGIVNITNENIEYFQRVVRMSLPYKLVSMGSKEEILNFLKNLHENGKSQKFDKTQNPPETPPMDFDLSELTTEQQAALKLYNSNNKTNN